MRYTLEKMNYEKLGYEHTIVVVWVKWVYKQSNALGLSAQYMYINYSFSAQVSNVRSTIHWIVFR